MVSMSALIVGFGTQNSRKRLQNDSDYDNSNSGSFEWCNRLGSSVDTEEDRENLPCGSHQSDCDRSTSRQQHEHEDITEAAESRHHQLVVKCLDTKGVECHRVEYFATRYPNHE